MTTAIRKTWLVLLLASAATQGRSFVAVTSWPSFRFGDDHGRFEWFVDVQWESWVGSGRFEGRPMESNELRFAPSLGCNIQLYDSTFKAYVGGTLGTQFLFVKGTFTDEYWINALLGGGIEFVFSPKLSLFGEYMLGLSAAFVAEPLTTGWEQQWLFFPRPSVHLRYYIGPW